MSSKRSRPYDDPPSPESSEGDEDEEEEQTPIQNPKKPQSDEELEVEEEEVDEEVDGEEEEENDADLMKKPTNNNTKVSQPESESGSESESESESEAEAETNYIAIPIVKESPSSKLKNEAKTTSLVEEKLKKAAKAVKPSPKQQVSSGGGEDDEDGGEKKTLFVRVWSYEDEIAVLQGMIDFRNGNGKDPLSNSSNADEFYNFVKQKLSNGKFTKAQVVEKGKRLKKKYMTNVAKSNKGKAVEFSDPHDLKVYKLSGIIWGENAVENATAKVKASSSNAKSGSSNAKSGSSVATIGVVALPASDYENVGTLVKGGGRSAKRAKTSEVNHAMEVDVAKKVAKREEGVGEWGFAELYPHLMKSFEGEYVPKVAVLEGLKSCLGMVDSAVLEDWERKCKDVHVAEMELFLKKIALMREQGTWFFDAIKSPKS